jgi:hypothetical protein
MRESAFKMENTPLNFAFCINDVVEMKYRNVKIQSYHDALGFTSQFVFVSEVEEENYFLILFGRLKMDCLFFFKMRLGRNLSKCCASNAIVL